MMPFKPVLLWTDALIWLLAAGVVFYAWRIRRHEHLVAPWRKVAKNRVGMISAVVLAAFTVVGLLDSLHLRLALPQHEGATRQHSPEVLSVFDLLAGNLRTHTEKTYSAPFALHLYAKETVENTAQPEGGQLRVFPRLKHGGAHLDNPAQRTADIAITAVRGMAYGALLWGVGVLALAGALARRWRMAPAAVWRRLWGHTQEDLPWRALLATLAVILLAGSVAAALSAHYHIFGTDKVGQDVFYLSLKSIRTGLVIGTVTTLVMLPFALLLGIAAGYFRGWVDDVIQYLYTTLNSIPSVLLIAAAVLMLQVYMDGNAEAFETVNARADMRLLFLCLILGMTSWTGLCRLLRGEAMKLREADFIQAATAFGVGHVRIILRHILPNVMHIVLISVVLDFSGLVLAEAVLSYVGVGVDPTTQSWGNMINAARLEMAREPIVWWSLAAAFVFMFTLVLAANLFADSVRDAFDPRVK
jgi:peptide/nickel transport system permease protein